MKCSVAAQETSTSMSLAAALASTVAVSGHFSGQLHIDSAATAAAEQTQEQIAEATAKLNEEAKNLAQEYLRNAMEFSKTASSGVTTTAVSTAPITTSASAAPISATYIVNGNRVTVPVHNQTTVQANTQSFQPSAPAFQQIPFFQQNQTGAQLIQQQMPQQIQQQIPQQQVSQQMVQQTSQQYPAFQYMSNPSFTSQTSTFTQAIAESTPQTIFSWAVLHDGNKQRIQMGLLPVYDQKTQERLQIVYKFLESKVAESQKGAGKTTEKKTTSSAPKSPVEILTSLADALSQ